MNKKNDLSKAGPIKTDEYYWAKSAYKDPLFLDDVKGITLHDQSEIKNISDKFCLRESDVEFYIMYSDSALENPPGITVSPYDGKSDTISIQITRDFRKENLNQCWPIIESALKTLPGYKKSLKLTSFSDLPYAIFRAIKFYNCSKKEIYDNMKEGTLLPRNKKLNMDYGDFVKYYDKHVKGKLERSS